eukprot:gb/GEZN01012381.1/.p1 GENE.gb/GEZN01012381.1/~~gb/GEZN01012381.1/.p1  ORF type:complete len:222 (-),score=13.93 gb/GEZN01012381.1/:376-1041(-)
MAAGRIFAAKTAITLPFGSLANGKVCQRCPRHLSSFSLLRCHTVRVASLRSPFSVRLLSTTPQDKERSEHREEPEKHETHKQKYVRLWNQYGAVFIGTYLSVYVGTLGMIYVVISNGLVVPADLMSLTEYIGVPGSEYGISNKTGNLALAWICTKFTEPLRFAVTVVATPSVARAVGRAPPRTKKLHGKTTAANPQEEKGHEKSTGAEERKGKDDGPAVPR